MTHASDALLIDDEANSLRHCVDEALGVYTQFGEGCPESLREAVRYSLLAPGKRFRPLLVMTAAKVCGGSIDAALPAACAVEMIHAYSLVHDDLPAMDDDDLRRGQPSCHRKFDEAIAILVGDALQALAFEVLACHTRPPERAAACCAILAKAAGACQLVGGQVDDIQGNRVGQDDLDSLESIHARKTGAMIRVSLRLGAIVAGADQRQQHALDAYGRCLGLLFQITDDLLDVRGNEATVGKRLGKDECHGKLSFPGLLGVDQSLDRAKQLYEEALEALSPLAGRTGRLEALARYVLHRNR